MVRELTVSLELQVEGSYAAREVWARLCHRLVCPTRMGCVGAYALCAIQGPPPGVSESPRVRVQCVCVAVSVVVAV